MISSVYSKYYLRQAADSTKVLCAWCQDGVIIQRLGLMSCEKGVFVQDCRPKYTDGVNHFKDTCQAHMDRRGSHGIVE